MNEQRICILGLGGGGLKIAGRVVGLASSGVSVAVVDTDGRSLGDSNVSRKLRIGQTRTGGLGAGGDPEIGRLAVEDELTRIKPLFSQAELLILVVALGGGTGSGGAAPVLQAAREAGCLTLCIATGPFSFEGEERGQRAEAARAALRTQADAVIEVPNDRLFESVGETTLTEAFTRADEVLGAAVRSVWRLLTHAGYIRLDFADLSAFARGCGGLCWLAYGNGRGPDKAQAAARELLQSPLTGQSELLRGAQSVLVSIVGGPDLSLKEVGDVMQALTAQLPDSCRVVMGTVVDDAWRNKLMVTTLFSDCREAPAEGEAPAPPARGNPPQRKTKKGTGTRGATRPRTSHKGRGKQTSLSFEAAARGRFKDVAPTVLDGEDFDIPTFQRRGITIEKE